MEQEDFEYFKAAEAFIEAMSEGKLKTAVQNLRQLTSLESLDLVSFANMLDGEANPKLFPWRVRVVQGRRGRPAIHHVQHKNKNEFFDLLSARKIREAAECLRKKGKLNSAEVKRLADLLEDSETKKLPWRLELRQRRRGNPVNSLRTSATAFQRSLLVDKADFPKREASIQDVMTRIGRARSTIQTARQRTKRHKKSY
jgi:hypothetical protein